MSVDELEKKEEELFRTGPLSVLTTSVKTNSQAGRQAHRCTHSSLPLPHYNYPHASLVREGAQWGLMLGCMHPRRC